MTHLEKLEALLDEMGVFYEREDNDTEISITIFGHLDFVMTFDLHGKCRDY